MNPNEIDQLETNLRALGRRLGSDAPSAVLLNRVQSEANTLLVAQSSAIAMRVSRRRQRAIYCLLLACLPVPLLFLWIDWSAMTSLFESVLPAAALSVFSGVYLWIKVAALMLIYAIALPLLYLAAVARTKQQLQYGATA